jgi:hypothetical protein
LEIIPREFSDNSDRFAVSRRRRAMYRFSTLNEYKKRLGQLNRKIKSLKRHHADAQSIVNCEALKLSYLIEMKDFSLRND